MHHGGIRQNNFLILRIKKTIVEYCSVLICCTGAFGIWSKCCQGGSSQQTYWKPYNEGKGKICQRGHMPCLITSHCDRWHQSSYLLGTMVICTLMQKWQDIHDIDVTMSQPQPDMSVERCCLKPNLMKFIIKFYAWGYSTNSQWWITGLIGASYFSKRPTFIMEFSLNLCGNLMTALPNSVNACI